MRGTPRTFVGSVVFVLDRPVCRHIAARVGAELARTPGIAVSELDLATSTLLVTAEHPVDRGDVVLLLDRLGCRVRA